MPLYEYECTQCKRHTEKIQKFSDAEITACPFCGGLLERVISAPAIAFKGGGWYKDGYGNAKPSTAKSEAGGDSGSPSSSSSDASSSSSSDAAPASAPASAPTATTPAATPAPAAPSSSSSASSTSDKK
jgi:putative FmdB family regulatory protein